MPSLRRPDGVEIHWDERGAGPTVLVAAHVFAFPGVYAGLIDELARDHRVITYDLRGNGKSTRVAPETPADDAADLEAVLEEVGGASAAAAIGDAGARAAAVAAARPDLIGAVLVAGASSVPPGALASGEGPVSSRTTVAMMLALSQRNPRAGIRGLLELTNPGMSPDELRGRIDATLAYCDVEGLRRRQRWYFEPSEIEPIRALGDRFWIAHWESAWSPREVLEEVRRLLPACRIETVAEGAITRPDLTANLVRRALAES